MRAARGCWFDYFKARRAFAFTGLHKTLGNASANAPRYYRAIYSNHAASVNEHATGVNMNFYA